MQNACLKLNIVITGAAAAPLKMIFAGPCLSPRSALPPVQICLMWFRLAGTAAARKELLGLPFVGYRMIASQEARSLRSDTESFVKTG
jgi:hypothetical protein